MSDETSRTAPALGEFALIDRFFTAGGARRADVILGIGDDAALLRIPDGEDLVAAVDSVVEGRHFPAGTTARSIGHRALAVNLSDLAAMGAAPAWATLALTVPQARPDWLAEFSAGLLELAAEHGVALVGGDTTCGPLCISVQILGTVPRGMALRRAGARAGDLLVVSGTLGDAGAGLALVTANPRALETTGNAAAALIRRFDYPTPRVGLGLAARGMASAAMDLSDGLTGDLPKLAAASGLSAHVEVERLPMSDSLLAVADPERARAWALSAGDDYELLLAVPAANLAGLERESRQLNLTLSVIGELRAGAGVTYSLNGAAFTPASRGYDHFA